MTRARKDPFEVNLHRQLAYAQEKQAIRFAWGAAGLRSLLPDSDVMVVVDVLSFSTSVDIAVSQGARVYPCRWNDDRAAEFARHRKAILAGSPGQQGFTLSPGSLRQLPPDCRLVLPSPNGSTLSLESGDTPTLAGCLRNAVAAAEAAQMLGERISVIAAGERWPDGSLRPADEDLLGAGAIINALAGRRSAEALAAERLYRSCRPDLADMIRRCVSGQELISRGRAEDVHLASELDVSQTRPLLSGGAYQQA